MNATELVQELASLEAWKLVRYFPDDVINKYAGIRTRMIYRELSETQKKVFRKSFLKSATYIRDQYAKYSKEAK